MFLNRFVFTLAAVSLGSPFYSHAVAQHIPDNDWQRPTPRLECRSAGQSSWYYLANVETGTAIEPFAHKTRDDCISILNLSREVTCIAGQNRMHKLFNVTFGHEIDPQTSLTFDQCLTTLESSNNRFGLTCSTRYTSQDRYDYSTKSALYDFRRDVFVERYHERSFENCIEALYTGNPFAHPKTPVVVPPVIIPPVIIPPVIVPPVIVPPVEGTSFYSLNSTVVKSAPIDSKKLAPNQKCTVSRGESLILQNASEVSATHWKGTLTGLDSCALSGTVVYIYIPHWSIF